MHVVTKSTVFLRKALLFVRNQLRVISCEKNVLDHVSFDIVSLRLRFFQP